MSEHLHSAAAALGRILHDRHPEHSWVIEVREESGQWKPLAGAMVSSEHPGPVSEDPDALHNGNGVPPPDLPDDDGFEEAA